MLKRNSDGIYPKSKLFRLPIKSFSRGKNFQFSPASHRLEFFYNFGDNILLYGCLQYMLFIVLSSNLILEIIHVYTAVFNMFFYSVYNTCYFIVWSSRKASNIFFRSFSQWEESYPTVIQWTVETRKYMFQGFWGKIFPFYKS